MWYPCKHAPDHAFNIETLECSLREPDTGQPATDDSTPCLGINCPRWPCDAHGQPTTGCHVDEGAQRIAE